MRLLILSLSLMVSLHLQAQKTSPGKPAKVTTPLPMTLGEFYAVDSVNFIYNALGKINAYGNCNRLENGNVEGFNSVQNTFYLIGPYLGIAGESVGHSLMEVEDGNEAIEAMKRLGLTQLPGTIEEYGKFARANKEVLLNGSDEALSTKMWYYDSLIYAQISSAPDLDILYNQLRYTGMFIKQDGKELDPMASGTVSIKSMKGARLEEIMVEKGFGKGYSFSSNANGEPVSEINQFGDWMVSKHYFSNGRISSIDSTDITGGRSYSRMFFPNGKLNTEYSSDYQYGPDGSLTSGGSREKSYYSNGQLACETWTDHMGNFRVVSAFDKKGKSTIKDGTGKVSRETIDYLSGMSTISTNEHVNHMQNGLNELYVNDKLISSYVIRDGLMVGAQKSFHWKNGKLISEVIYDESGNYVSERNLFDQNAPKISGNKVKVLVTSEPDMSCARYGIYDPNFTRAMLKNEKELKAMLSKQPDLLHYNTPGLVPQEPITYKNLTIDISQAGKPINVLGYEDNDAKIINMLQFTPAMYQGKPVKSRVNVTLIAIWR